MSGAILSTPDIRDYTLVPKTIQYDYSMFSELQGIEPLDQGDVGACTACAVTMLAQFFSMQDNRFSKLSPAFVYGKRYSHTAPGMSIRDALKTLNHIGVPALVFLPKLVEVPEAIDLVSAIAEHPNLVASAAKAVIKEYYSIATDEFTVRSVLHNHPIIAVFSGFDDSEIDKRDNIVTLGDAPTLHAVLIYGADKRGWLIKNSWGQSWGDNGTATIPFHYPIREAWVAVDDPTVFPEADFVINKPRYTGWVRRFLLWLQTLLAKLQKRLTVIK